MESPLQDYDIFRFRESQLINLFFATIVSWVAGIKIQVARSMTEIHDNNRWKPCHPRPFEFGMNLFNGPTFPLKKTRGSIAMSSRRL